MGKVYANGMEVCSGSSGGKSVAAMPDVCWTQPMAPPTPQGVPVPYPSSGMASDIMDGSTTVKIGGKPIALKDKSYLKKVAGDEAGNAGTKGLISQTNSGKVYFAAWSMNVKVEGLNVVRHLDLCTHNHGSAPGNTGPWPFAATMKPDPPTQSWNCTLVTYRPKKCPEGTTGHHCIPDHCFREPGDEGTYYPGAVPHREGLCVCVTGTYKDTVGSGERSRAEQFANDDERYAALAEHGRIHMLFDALEAELGQMGKPPNTATLGDLENAAAKAISTVTGCDPQRLKDDLRKYHNDRKPSLKEDSRWRADPSAGAKPIGKLGTVNAKVR